MKTSANIFHKILLYFSSFCVCMGSKLWFSKILFILCAHYALIVVSAQNEMTSCILIFTSQTLIWLYSGYPSSTEESLLTSCSIVRETKYKQFMLYDWSIRDWVSFCAYDMVVQWSYTVYSDLADEKSGWSSDFERSEQQRHYKLKICCNVHISWVWPFERIIVSSNEHRQRE